jgi:hypothetical protein
VRVSAGVRADGFHFDVLGNLQANSGTATAGLASPKFGIVFAPLSKLELYGNFGYGYHSNDARGATIAVDPLTGRPADRVRPLVATRGGEFGVRSTGAWGIDSELVFVGDASTTEAGRPSRRTGIEWANYYSPTKWLTIDTDLSWSSSRFTDGNPAGYQIPGAVTSGLVARRNHQRRSRIGRVSRALSRIAADG